MKDHHDLSDITYKTAVFREKTPKNLRFSRKNRDFYAFFCLFCAIITKKISYFPVEMRLFDAYNKDSRIIWCAFIERNPWY